MKTVKNGPCRLFQRGWIINSWSFVSFLPVLQSTFSSSWLCLFTMATCTRDILSPTAAAPPRPAALHSSAPSGCGCQTTRCAKPACTRCCLPTLTCSFMREFEGSASPCHQRSSQKLASYLTSAFPVVLPHLMWQRQHGYQEVALWLRPEIKAILELS